MDLLFRVRDSKNALRRAGSRHRLLGRMSWRNEKYQFADVFREGEFDRLLRSILKHWADTRRPDVASSPG